MTRDSELDRRAFDERYEAGLRTRREMFGAEHVARRMAAVDDFSRPFAEFLNTHVFNDVWNRPGLSRAARSMVNVGMLAALGRSPELKGHIGAALNNGVTPVELREVLFQIAAYCGAPAAVDGFRIAAEVFRERGIVFEEPPGGSDPGGGRT